MMLSVINPLPVELESADVRRSPGKCSTIALFAGHLRDGELALCGSFNHLVGAGEQCCRHGEAKGHGSFEIDHQFETRRLHHGHFARAAALQNLSNINASLTIHPCDAGAIAEQASRCWKLLNEIDGR